MKIAQHEVAEITRETAQVGCTRVTLQEAEALVAAMKAAPEPPRLKITKGKPASDGFTIFSMSSKYTGWLAVSDKEGLTYETIYGNTLANSGFGNKTVVFCLHNEDAEALYQYLKKDLGH